MRRDLLLCVVCALVVLALGGLVSCAHREAPKNNFERLLYAQAVLAAVADDAAAKLEARKLPPAKARVVGAELEKAYTALQVARAVLFKELPITANSDPATLLATAEASLRIASELLKEIGQ